MTGQSDDAKEPACCGCPTRAADYDSAPGGRREFDAVVGFGAAMVNRTLLSAKPSSVLAATRLH